MSAFSPSVITVAQPIVVVNINAVNSAAELDHFTVKFTARYILINNDALEVAQTWCGRTWQHYMSFNCCLIIKILTKQILQIVPKLLGSHELFDHGCRVRGQHERLANLCEVQGVEDCAHERENDL
jgi:hypothetical protein